MEFTVPRTPPKKFQKVKPFPQLDSSDSVETEDLNDGEGGEGGEEEEMNSYDEEKENNDETETSVQIEPETSINIKSVTPQAQTRTSDHNDVNDEENSPTLKEKINKLYSYVPEIASHFTIIKRIGEGTFSSVYLARLKHHPEIEQMFALKHIIPTSHPLRIENELKCLLKMGGCDNVMGVKMCVRNRDHVVIVMPYFPHIKFQDCLFQMKVEEAREYMKNLLIALRRVHQFDVIHRDVKPANFLYNRDTKQYALVDFGLASGPFLIEPSKMATYKSTQHAQQNQKSTTSFTTSTSTSATSSLKPPTTSNSTHYVLSSSSASALVRTSKPVTHGAFNSITHKPSPLAATSTSTAKAMSTVTVNSMSRRSPSRQPLSPLKRGDTSAGRRNLMGRITKLNDRREPAPLPPAATKIFAPNFSSASASLLRQRVGLCDCYGKPVICELCIARNMQMAPRAGTAGFRAPEVLLKSPNQGTAVDIWSAGVIFLSVLSARYPFFKANDDLGYMAQILSLLGTKPCIKAALSYGKLMTLSESIEPCDLQVMCEKLRHTQIAAGAATGAQFPPLPPQTTASSSLSSSSSCLPNTSGSSSPTSSEDEMTSNILDSWSNITPRAYHLLARLLDPNPKTRITAEDALKHPFFYEVDESDSEKVSREDNNPFPTSDNKQHDLASQSKNNKNPTTSNLSFASTSTKSASGSGVSRSASNSNAHSTPKHICNATGSTSTSSTATSKALTQSSLSKSAPNAHSTQSSTPSSSRNVRTAAGTTAT